MEAIITKQQDILNGNEAYLMGVDKLGQQIWIEVLNGIEIKCEALKKDNNNIGSLLDKKVFDSSKANYLSLLFNQYSTLDNYIKKHEDDNDGKKSMKNLIKEILEVVKPTIK